MPKWGTSEAAIAIVTHTGAGTPQRDSSLWTTRAGAGPPLSDCSPWRTGAGAEKKHQEVKSSREKPPRAAPDLL